MQLQIFIYVYPCFIPFLETAFWKEERDGRRKKVVSLATWLTTLQMAERGHRMTA